MRCIFIIFIGFTALFALDGQITEVKETNKSDQVQNEPITQKNSNLDNQQTPITNVQAPLTQNINALQDSMFAPHSSHSHNHDALGLDANVGIFTKQAVGETKDSYSTLFSKLLLSTRAFDLLNIGVGIRAYAPLSYGAASSYIESKFIAYTAYLGIERKLNNTILGAKVGRFDLGHLDWIAHSIQGAKIYLDNKHINLYTFFVDEQSHALNDFAADFNFYKEMYDGQKLYVGGLDVFIGKSIIGAHVYKMNNFFDVYGAKIEINLGSKTFYSNTQLKYAYLKSTFTQNEHHEHNHNSHDGHESENEDTYIHLGHITGKRGDTFIFIAQESFFYKNITEFGVGYQLIGRHFFDLANMGNASKFESHDYGIIKPGSMHEGQNTTNMYNEATQTFFGFASINATNRLKLEFIARDSRNNQTIQSAVSLATKFDINYNVDIGAIVVYMPETHIHDTHRHRIDKSFCQAYARYIF